MPFRRPYTVVNVVYVDILSWSLVPVCLQFLGLAENDVMRKCGHCFQDWSRSGRDETGQAMLLPQLQYYHHVYGLSASQTVRRESARSQLLFGQPADLVSASVRVPYLLANPGLASAIYTQAHESVAGRLVLFDIGPAQLIVEFAFPLLLMR